ncbi:hypothetical protein NDU88_001339 [Pleurodeles waltl]|uniref:Uncharacterized protein n=1 Tax=Pleurodeles waltl TaxID=8319 RepID=A0AAV7LCH1_PLEWA|nr:hypothetical protein NDU88_001339 [Pleurodeles waltl]
MPGTATSTDAPVAFTRAPKGFLVPASVSHAGGQLPDFWAATRPRGSKISAPRLPGGRHNTPARRITRPAVVCAGILNVPAPLRLGPAASPRPGPESQRSQRRSSAGASDGPVRRPRGPQFLVGIRA